MYFLNQFESIFETHFKNLRQHFKNVFHMDLFSRTTILHEESKRMQRVQKFANLRKFSTRKFIH